MPLFGPSSRDSLYDSAQQFLSGTTDWFLGWGPKPEDPNARTAGASGVYNKCGKSGDCGAGFYCHQGECVPVGNGNTSNNIGQTGCSTGPDENGGVTGGTSCGRSSGTANLGGCYTAGCGDGAGGGCGLVGDDGGGKRCCRYSASSIQCWNGDCPDPPSPCSSFCTGQKASYGSSSGGCSDRNSCDECYSCVDNSCVQKEDPPCHCAPNPDDNCGDRPGEPLTCCNHKDTCAGRINEVYCHPTYRAGVPRCYDPEYACKPPENPEKNPDCFECTNGTGSSVPSGCTQTGIIIVEGQDPVYLYKCCTPKRTPECFGCATSADCGLCNECKDGICTGMPSCVKTCAELKPAPGGGAINGGCLPLNPCWYYRITASWILSVKSGDCLPNIPGECTQQRVLAQGVFTVQQTVFRQGGGHYSQYCIGHSLGPCTTGVGAWSLSDVPDVNCGCNEACGDTIRGNGTAGPRPSGLAEMAWGGNLCSVPTCRFEYRRSRGTLKVEPIEFVGGATGPLF